MQTRSGKTHSLEGSRSQPGIVERAVRHVFAGGDAHSADEDSILMSISMLEVYNDNVYDLLGEPRTSSPRAPTDVTGAKLEFTSDSHGARVSGMRPPSRLQPRSTLQHHPAGCEATCRERGVAAVLFHATSRVLAAE
jgi:kinesin family member 22